jgi:alpha-L-fucosidase
MHAPLISSWSGNNGPFGGWSAVLVLAAVLLAPALAPAQVEEFNEQEALGNKPERVEWFSRLGFGMFIHWSVDSQLGSVISHSLVGADEDYCRRFFEELPKTFDPDQYDPEAWADLAKLAGMKYVVFTTKHHSGFCMFDTDTTDFSIMHTPYGKDVTRQLVEAFRSRGIAIGFYFSPDDFWFLWKQGTVIGRRRPGVLPQENPELMKHDRAQLRELLTNYGPVDIMFIDGKAEGLRELCWQLQPNLVVTRGAIPTPEQHVPGVAIEGVWESCMTMGTQWQYKPTNESYKSGTEVIERLIETRAKGGNLLMNVGPHPDGRIPPEQEARLREVALWNFINGEAVYGVEPWIVTHEENIWFTKKRSADTVSAIVTKPNWPRGQRREITLQSVKAGDETTVEILGQTGEVLEYSPKTDPKARWTQDDRGLHISAMRAQRIYNDSKWPNPVVLKITDAEPAGVPPVVVTRGAKAAEGGKATLGGELIELGDADKVEVGFEYRFRHDPTQPLAEADPWRSTTLKPQTEPAPFELELSDLEPGRAYEYRAKVKHPRMTLYGDRKRFKCP